VPIIDIASVSQSVSPFGASYICTLSITFAEAAEGVSIPPFNAMGTPLQLIKEFGAKAGFEQAVHELQDALYGESYGAVA
jgi:hypothetical protein